MTDAVVIGSGPNGLVAANLLADAGWSVLVREGADRPGGAVKSGEITAPGFTSDLFSAFYPLATVSPALAALDLERWGLEWCHAPLVVANPTSAGPTALLSTELDVTAASLDEFASGDGDAWRQLHGEWARMRDPLLGALMGPFPPVRAGARLAARLGPRGLLDFGRMALLPLRRLADERFQGAGGGLLLAGHLMHLDGSVDGAGAVMPTMLLAMIGQDHGFPVPKGGAQALTDVLVQRLEAKGGKVVCGAAVTEIEVKDGRAVGVRSADGSVDRVGRAVLADTSAPALYRRLLPADAVPAKVFADLDRFEWDAGSFKLDWALREPIPWKDPEVRRAGTVHVGLSMAEISKTAWQLSNRRIPDEPFLLLGQMAVADPTRAPAGAEVAWAYAHVPHDPLRDDGGDGITGTWDERETDAFASRMEARIEALAPGFRDTIIARHAFTPKTLESANPNLVDGAVGGGTAQLHQQLVWRPTAGSWGRPETPVKGVYLASAAAHPGGGVHGVCGANAARAALLHHRLSFGRRR